MKNRQAIHQQRLRNAVHHRTQHRLEAHFIGQRAAEFNQRAPVIQPVAIEKAIQPRLNPFAERLKQKRRDDDGDHAAHRPGRLRVEICADQRDQREVNRSHAAVAAVYAKPRLKMMSTSINR